MLFKEQILATFIGAITAFIFSLLLFYLTEVLKNNKNNKNLNRNLQKEFDYNIAYVEQYITDFEKLVRQIAINDKEIFTIFRFYKLQRLFILESFNRGLLYSYLLTEEINDLDAMLNFFTNVTDQMAWTTLGGYKDDKINQTNALRLFEYDKDQLEKFLGVLKNLKIKLKKLK